MAKICIVVALVGLAACSGGVRAWNRATLVASTALIACDAGQTMRGLSDGIPETNPMLGADPSASKLVAYDAAATGVLVGTYAATGKVLGERWQWVVPFAVSWFELALITRNSIVLERGVVCGVM
jgi:hypothetical protein